MNSSILRSTLALAALAVTANLFAAKPGDWPQWRGANADGLSLEKGLLTEWPEGGPKVAWQIDTIGDGYSSLAIVGLSLKPQPGTLPPKSPTRCLDQTTSPVSAFRQVTSPPPPST